MQGKRKSLILFVLFFVGLLNCNVMGYTGNGKSGDPYVVSNESDLQTILTDKGKSSWVYVGIKSNITLTKSITLGDGKFRIYAMGANRTIKRSSDTSKSINKETAPKYCFKVNGDTTLQLGYAATSYQLVLDGNGSQFTGKKRSSGWLYIGAGSEVLITSQCVVTNVKNNIESANGSPINCQGTLTIQGEVKSSFGYNGGAIKVTNSGYLKVANGAKIHNCSSETEGGGIYVGDDAVFVMEGGEIYQCNSKEEGGGIFATSRAYCEIKKGKIHHNSAVNTGGGIFSGMGATLIIGEQYNGGSGPEISENTSSGSGGGIRCNGGVSNTAGGTTYIYGSLITKNKAGDYGGGISCANASSNKKSIITFVNATVENNSCDKNGGGVWIGSGVKGLNGAMIEMTNCKIQKNTAKEKAGGIKLSSNMLTSQSIVSNNGASVDGGGIYLTENVTLKMDSGEVKNNTAGKLGAGIYVMGTLQMLDTATVSMNNRVYLCKDTFVDIVGALSKKNSDIAYIESEIKSNGTKLVRVNYGSATASTELYASGKSEDEYNNEEVYKKFSGYALAENQCLRPSEKVEGYDSKWIIISEKYKIIYSKNTTDTVSNLPDVQLKFWNESILVSAKEVEREGYQTVEKSHWNLLGDGKGETYKPGTTLKLNRGLILYAQWEKAAPKELFITASDRYYVVGQNIILDYNEVLRKVIVEDDLMTGEKYSIKILEISEKNGSNIKKGDITNPESYMNTDTEQEYVLAIRAENTAGTLSKTGELHIFVLDTPNTTPQIRFISQDYLYTLSSKSKWVKELKNELQQSLSREQGIIHIEVSHEEIKTIKKDIEDNKYILTSKMNQAVVKKYGRIL